MEFSDIHILKTGTLEQIGKSGDIICIDWGIFLSGR